MAHPVTLHRLVKIQADSQGNLPKTIELLRTGNWTTPYHGDFEITTADLHQFVANAMNGIGLVAADPKVPLNYGHESWDKAAGWIDPQAGKLYVSTDGQALIGEPDWTPAAQQAIADGEWKYISPEFNPRSVPWEDPEESMSFVDNVLTGAALTNIPLFKKLKPVQASRVKGSSDTSTKPQGETMDLATLRAKEVTDLTDEEKAFLSEHKAELSPEDLQKFGLADEPAAPVQPEQPETPEEPQEPEAPAAPVEASRKTVSISADRLAKLEADAKAGVEAAYKLARTEASEFAAGAIKAGRIKSGQKESLVDRLVKASKEEAAFLKSFVEGLPENKELFQEAGKDVTEDTSAMDAVFEKAHQIVADKGITFQAAVSQVIKADSKLAAQLDKENAQKGVK